MLTLKDEKKEKYRTNVGLFEVLSEKFKAQHNEEILHCKTANGLGNRIKMPRNRLAFKT